MTTYHTLTLNGGIESLTYDSTTNKIYGPIHGTDKIYSGSVSNPTTTYSLTTVLSGGHVFNGSSPLTNDGTHLYITPEIANGYFLKIRMSDMVTITTTSPDADITLHGGGILDSTSEHAFFTNLSGGIVKLKLSDMTYTKHFLDIGMVTDDCCKVELNAEEYLVCVTESRAVSSAGSNTGMTLVNMNDMSYINIDCLPSYGVFYDNIESKVYSLCYEGFIESWSVSSLEEVLNGWVEPDQYAYLSDVFVMPQGGANEFCITDNGKYFVTVWSNMDGGGNLIQFEFVKYTVPLLTKRESFYRNRYVEKTQYLNSNSSSVKVNAETSNLIINPPSTITGLEIKLVTKPTKDKKLFVYFGGTIGVGSNVVNTLTFNYATYGTINLPLKGGDKIEMVFNDILNSWFIETKNSVSEGVSSAESIINAIIFG